MLELVDENIGQPLYGITGTLRARVTVGGQTFVKLAYRKPEGVYGTAWIPDYDVLGRIKTKPNDFSVMPDRTIVIAPQLLLCPLTGKRFVDPVVACDGYTYERSAIESYFNDPKHKKYNNNYLGHCFGLVFYERKFYDTHIVSPVTKERMYYTTLYPDHAIRDIVQHGNPNVLLCPLDRTKLLSNPIIYEDGITVSGDNIATSFDNWFKKDQARKHLSLIPIIDAVMEQARKPGLRLI